MNWPNSFMSPGYLFRSCSQGGSDAWASAGAGAWAWAAQTEAAKRIAISSDEDLRRAGVRRGRNRAQVIRLSDQSELNLGAILF